MSWLGGIAARAFVRLRLLIVLAWIAAVAWVVVTLPPLQGNSSGTLQSLLPAGSAAVRAEQISTRDFKFPLLSRTIVVIRNPRGLPLARQEALATLAVRLSQHRMPAYYQIAGALPLVNTVGPPGFARHPGTTALLYLLFSPSLSTSARVTVAHRLIAREIGRQPGEYVGLTGAEPATVAEQGLINSRLLWVALATLLVAAIAVGVRFRAVPAALLTVVAVVCAYLVADRVVSHLAKVSGISVPAQVEPVLVVLVFGVATDYSVFFLSRFRALLRAGVEQRPAAVQTVREITPIVFTAGISVALATSALLVADPDFIRGFGPALAIAVMLAMLVAITFVPAALALGGGRMFWPRATEARAHAGRPASTSPRREPRVRRWAGAIRERLTGA
ncbi:MAG: MMPL family transporter, partial [Solirubrobacteraceae bacterium]